MVNIFKDSNILYHLASNVCHVFLLLITTGHVCAAISQSSRELQTGIRTNEQILELR